MNKILPEKPLLPGDVYAPVLPRWLTISIQLFSLCFAIAITWFSYLDWTNMPLFFKVLALLLLASFIFGTFHPKGWQRLSIDPFFFANVEGIFFPFTRTSYSYDKGVNVNSWLFVPWQNISHLRSEKHDTDGDGKSFCAVFDIKATDEELRDFFISHKWIDKITGNTSIVFYRNNPPSPSKVVARLQVIQNQYNSSFSNLID
ncbi:MAG: hypothetical protein Q8M99_04265 [Methylotenera sp.]|nr:hypothetical protein [Methylotenera sp.]